MRKRRRQVRKGWQEHRLVRKYTESEARKVRQEPKLVEGEARTQASSEEG